jgi:hypothetical protein
VGNIGLLQGRNQNSSNFWWAERKSQPQWARGLVVLPSGKSILPVVIIFVVYLLAFSLFC